MATIRPNTDGSPTRTIAAGADDRVLYDVASGALRWDADAPEAAVVFTVLTAGAAIAASDIWFI